MRRLFLSLTAIVFLMVAVTITPVFRVSVAVASPDTESLWSGSNSGTGVTITNGSDADGSGTGTWGSASSTTWAGSHHSWDFAIADSAAGAGTLNSVTLYLKHYQAGHVDDTITIDIYDGIGWNTVQTYNGTTPAPTSDTTDSWDVSSVLESWNKIDAAEIRVYGVSALDTDDDITWYVDTVEVRIDYTPPADISNTPTSYGFGNIAESSTYSTGLDYFTLTNNSAFAIDVSISGTDMTGGMTWTLSDTATPGPDVFGMKAGLEGGSYNIIVKKTGPYNNLVSGLSGSGTVKWGLQLLAPTAFSDGVAKTSTITLTAVQS